MKALRRSIKGDKDKTPQISIAPKSAIAIVPPKKVIRALYDYEAQTTQELSFSRGDFFHVIGRENDQDWYEACNPALPDARGLVPVAFFQALGRTERDSAQSDSSAPRTGASANSGGSGGSGGVTKNPDHDSGYAETSTTMVPTPAQSKRSSKGGQKNGSMVYGVVMYDFQAERADELQAAAGEAIIVIAQSNPEWFVAKPIGRLGGPGLIPVSFVEIRDMASNTPVPDAQAAVQRAGIPKVEEWKKMAADYKNSSITLGKFEVGGAPSQQSAIEQGMERMSLQQPSDNRASQGQQSQSQPSPAVYNPQRATQQSFTQTQTPYGAKSSPQLLAPLQASIPRYCFAEEKYWFVIEAELEDHRWWELSRYYEDFYDFQIALLTEFPAEAGNTGAQKRTLPYMPGPVSYVTDAITEGRLHNLDAYVKNLLAQPTYISRCNLVRQFFAPREGDYEMETDSNGNEIRLSGGSQPSSNDSPDASRNNVNGGGGSNGYGAPGLSAAPNRGPNGQPQMLRQASSFSQTTASPAVTPAAAGNLMKIKLSYRDDLVAIKVSSDIPFPELKDKIMARLRIDDDLERVRLSYKDDPSGGKVPMLSNEDLDVALSRNEKLLLYVQLI